ncbi:hypothetical protein T12_17019 [Trichinella patagoniensis]|uniref:Uncharacterized protein n=1 Tax=Trichinella patagoniensis TaxID=990121 RepID=A0A0V0ZAN8_9BILA|nr:hypothetical protein T12_17019 [Trichinella patagoniensis]
MTTFEISVDYDGGGVLSIFKLDDFDARHNAHFFHCPALFHLPFDLSFVLLTLIRMYNVNLFSLLNIQIYFSSSPSCQDETTVHVKRALHYS